MVNPLFLTQLALFFITSFISFTLSGIYFLERSGQKLNFWEKNILGTAIGFIFFTLLSYFLSVLKIHFLLLPIILVISVLTLKSYYILLKQIIYPSRNKILLLFTVFIFGIFGQMAVIAPSGTLVNGDLVYWSSHAHDSAWHIALAEEIKNGYPLQNPAFAGEKLINYHYFSDIAPSDFSKYFNFSLLDLYFRFFPFLFSLLLGSLSFLLGKKMGGDFLSGIWSTIFIYFGGSFGYIVTYIQNRSIGGESLFWATQIQSSTGNPPLITSFIIILTFLYLFNLLIGKHNQTIFLICILLVGSLSVFKIYGAVVILISIALLAILQLVKERKLYYFLLFLSGSIISAFLYLPNTSKTTVFLIFEPWWFIRTMVVAPDKLNWIDLELRRQTYLSEGNLKRVIFLETEAFLIFLVGNLGTRILGFFSFIKLLRDSFYSPFNLFLVLISLISLILPLLFLQKGVASNSIQFMQYFLLVMGLLAGLTVANFYKKIKFLPLKLFLSFLIILISIPTQLMLIQNFYTRPPFTKIDQRELSALQFLKEIKANGIVITPPYNKELDLHNAIPNIWDWSDTAYVSALSAKRTYLEDNEQVDIMGYDFKNRLDIQKLIFNETDPTIFSNLLKRSNLKYLYFPKELAPRVELLRTALQLIYSNSFVEIWSLN